MATTATPLVPVVLVELRDPRFVQLRRRTVVAGEDDGEHAAAGVVGERVGSPSVPGSAKSGAGEPMAIDSGAPVPHAAVRSRSADIRANRGISPDSLPAPSGATVPG